MCSFKTKSHFESFVWFIPVNMMPEGGGQALGILTKKNGLESPTWVTILCVPQGSCSLLLQNSMSKFPRVNIARSGHVRIAGMLKCLTSEFHQNFQRCPPPHPPIITLTGELHIWYVDTYVFTLTYHSGSLLWSMELLSCLLVQCINFTSLTILDCSYDLC